MESQIRDHNYDNKKTDELLSGTTIVYYGAAANVEHGADMYKRLGGHGPVYLQSERYDFVNGLIGRNPDTFGPKLSKFEAFMEGLKMLGSSKATAHGCYGRAGNGCGAIYGERVYWTIYPGEGPFIPKPQESKK